LMDGRAHRAKVARKVRASVLGPPALDDEARAARLAKASDELGVDPSEIESLLWIDLAEERPVTLPDGRPDEQRLAAFANVDRIQRAVRRARHVRIHAWGDAHPLIRTAARYGLLVRVSSPDASTAYATRDAPAYATRDAPAYATRDAPGYATRDASAYATRDAPAYATRDAHVTQDATRDAHVTQDASPVASTYTILDIVGPLSLFHQTQVYGRSLAAIVPHLAGLARFVVEIDAEVGFGSAALRVTSPALLPPMPKAERGKPSIATKIASALDRTRGVLVERDPPPIIHGADRLFPDLAIEVTGSIVLERGRAPIEREADNDQERDAQVRSLDERDRDDRHATEQRDREDEESDRHATEQQNRAHDREPDESDLEDDRDLVPDLAALLAMSMSDEADRIASTGARPKRDHESTAAGARPKHDLELTAAGARPKHDLELTAAGTRPKRDREITATLPAVRRLDRSRCWFVEVVGFATSEYLAAKLARYEAAGIERVVLVVDDTRDAALATVRRVVAYKGRTIVADLLAIIGDTTFVEKAR
jgi:predicted nuclease of restriction endonuclease-like RecB superfamily